MDGLIAASLLLIAGLIYVVLPWVLVLLTLAVLTGIHDYRHRNDVEPEEPTVDQSQGSYIERAERHPVGFTFAPPLDPYDRT